MSAMERGRVVRSLKGRNKGKSAVVLSVEGNAAFIADGKEYKLAKPKLKNIKHLEPCNDILNESDFAFDSRLRKKLNGINGNC